MYVESNWFVYSNHMQQNCKVSTVKALFLLFILCLNKYN